MSKKVDLLKIAENSKKSNKTVRVNLSGNEDIWLKFQKGCEDKELIPSQVIFKIMSEFNELWEKN